METTVRIKSVNISEKKGTVKKPVDGIMLTGIGIQSDAHSGAWHRQVSMLGEESLIKFSKETGRKYAFGEFAENITSFGMDVYKSSVFDKFYNDQVELEVTQIGKKCHGTGCSIYQEIGNCIMPREGIFLRVKKPGKLNAGDFLKFKPKIYKIKIITVSDRASQGIYEDRSGPKLQQITSAFFTERNKLFSLEKEIIPDEPGKIESSVSDAIAQSFDLVFTTGGTGLGSRDNTPDVVKKLLDKEIPGIMEMIRIKYGMEKPNALLSRSVAGTSGKSLIYTLPGSQKAVQEYSEEIFKTIEHSWLMLYDIGDHQ